MKKILVLSSVLCLSMGIGFAWIAEDDTNSIETLQRQGYSDATLKIMDTVNYTNQGKNGDYQRVFEKKASKTKLGRGYSKVKFYVDPIQDDQNFGEHQINFTNNRMGNEETYAPKGDEIENL